ncbi:hypothetical protein PG990_013238 [Apiospora arundinis]|uniref:FAD-dependent pyridine nucleotide-disulfide oxidoreductase n=1 Tax=Apiospora arundinis TaxID=335852 RepID=A0ABR2HSZ3_9PEZI
MTETRKNIVVLGGSYGGISAAHNILKHTIPHLPNKESYQVVIISAASQVMCRPGCPRALISDDLLDQSRFFVNIPEQFEQYPKDNFRFIQGTATELDHQSRTVTYRTSRSGDETTEKIQFYALVIATGASTPSPLFSFNTDEMALRASWETFRKALPTARTIVIAGGGPTGVEVAGELGEYLNGRPGLFSSKLAKPKVAITVVTSASRILPGVLRDSLAEKAEGMLARVGVTVVKSIRVKSVSPESSGTEAAALATKTTVTLEDGEALEADIYIPAFGMRYNTGFVAKDLLTPEGRVETNSSTLRVDKAGPRIYAVGDVSSAARPAVHSILGQIPVLSANLKRDLLIDAGVQNKTSPGGEDRVFKEDKRETQMVPIGQSKGVGAFAGWAFPSFLVWLIKGRDYWLWTTGNLWSGKQWIKEG